MENPSRNLDKPVVSFTPPKFTKRIQTWNLLFVDNFGKTKHIKWFKGLVIFFMVFLSLAVLGDVFLYMLYRIEKSSYQLNIQMLNEKMQQKDALIKALEADKEKLIVSHIIDGKKPEDIPVSVPKEITDKPIDQLTREKEAEMMKLAGLESPDKPAAEPQPVEAPKKPEIKPEDVKPAPEPAPSEPPAAVLSKRVTADELETSYRRSSRSLKIQFNISNVNPKSEPATGFIFVILKPDKTKPNEWLAVPSSPFTDSRPSDYKKGQPFSINYFKTVYFEAENQKEPIPFKTATVLIYDKSGELMLEKDFNVSLN